MIRKVLHPFKKGNAKFHLRYICPSCPLHKRSTRDIKHSGKCYWNKQWKKGNYDSPPVWMGLRNYIRLHILKRPIVVCIKGKIFKGAKV